MSEQSTAVARTGNAQIKTFTDALSTPAMQKRIASVLPKHMTAERVIKIAVSAISRNPLLMQCSVESVMKNVIIASELGLELNGALGHAYLVPFKNKNQRYEAQLIAGYKGLVELARRSGFVVGVEARAVYENDAFEYEYGLEPKLKHKPITSGEAGALKYVYAIARYKSGYSDFVVCALPEIARHRARSKAKDNGPWVTDYEAMALKTAVRVLMKLSPQSPEMAQAIEVEEREERGEEGLGDLGFAAAIDEFSEADVVQTRTEQLAEAINQNGGTLAQTVDPQPPATATGETNGGGSAAHVPAVKHNANLDEDQEAMLQEIGARLHLLDPTGKNHNSYIIAWTVSKASNMNKLAHTPELLKGTLELARADCEAKKLFLSSEQQ